MAGTNPDFKPDEFRNGIHVAMAMGAAPDPANQPVFHFAGPLASVGPADIEAVPFDPAVDVTATETRPPVTVPCGIRYADDAGFASELGIITRSRLVLTLLDTDYAQIAGFTAVKIGPDTYDYRHTEPPRGLFDVGIWNVHVVARDEA